ncbi:hypothetical protein BDB00DRAFT_492706 [Zychaea mexicana]|uniref:uncharacterized protein n=1 Tax=Zychaea mexicana TaxID=64656 RepID=UPI0022FDFC00|nr:uncharacterized protein BDB00DRAFT_492706 [Zychaea mexicana]KAI9491347.1 hypothetical protein BDB00DRAFT_492706 [Zychaea mexicana]
MPELSEQEKLERRREKRKQKILASAENRLNRITGTAFPNRPSPTPSPSTSTSSLARSETPQRERPRSRSPSPAIFASTSTDTLRSRKASTTTTSSVPPLPPAAAAASQQTSQPRPADADPCESLGAPQPIPSLSFSTSDGTTPSLEAMFAAGEAGVPPPNLNDLLGGQFPFNPALLATLQQQQQQQQQQQMDGPTDTSAKYWNLLHFISMIWLGAYAVYTEWSTVGAERFAGLLSASSPEGYSGIHFPLFWYFVTLELMLQSARMLYQQGNTSSSSLLLSTLIQYLPPQMANAANVLLRYWIIVSALIKDCFVLVFIIGFAQILSTTVAGS